MEPIQWKKIHAELLRQEEVFAYKKGGEFAFGTLDWDKKEGGVMCYREDNVLLHNPDYYILASEIGMLPFED